MHPSPHRRSARPSPYRVSLADPGEIAGAIPQLLGFRPMESVLLIGLGGVRGQRVGLTVRADLPPPQHEPALARVLARSIGTDRPSGVVLAVVSEAADLPGPGLPHRSLVHELTVALFADGVPVRDALLVRDGRWWSYDCPDPCCRPGGGTPLPGGVSALEVASVAAGQVVADSREALVARIAPMGGRARGDMAAAGKRVDRETSDRLEAVGLDVVTEESWTAVVDGVARCRDRGALPDRVLARITWGLRDIRVRDRALQLALDDDPAVEALWTEATRRAPRSWVPAPATLLAVSAWLRGDGAMAGVALERALAADPRYRFARLLSDALAACMPPADLRGLIVSGTDDPFPGR